MPRECTACSGEGEIRKLTTCGHPNDPDAAILHEWVMCEACGGDGTAPREEEGEIDYERIAELRERHFGIR